MFPKYSARMNDTPQQNQRLPPALGIILVPSNSETPFLTQQASELLTDKFQKLPIKCLP